MRYYHQDCDNNEELEHYMRIYHLREFAEYTEDAIKSIGYVVDSLEAAVWCLVTTDTIGAIAGGLTCLYYGYDSVPEEWRKI